MQEPDYLALLESWRQLAAVYHSRAGHTIEPERSRALEQADRFDRLHVSLQRMIDAGTITMDGPRKLHEVPRAESGRHKECPGCRVVKNERHFGRKMAYADGLKVLCRECERERRVFLKAARAERAVSQKL